jgi:hypothetical protein
VYALDHEHAVLDLDLAGCLADQPSLARVDLAGFQRASEGAGQSAGCGGDDVVERGRSFSFAGCRNAVVVGDLVVNAEVDGVGLAREVRPSQRAANALDSNARDVLHVTHWLLLCAACLRHRLTV